MTHGTLAYPPHEASRLRRVRRYAVPEWMIEQATERRLAGDWRGACAAAGVDVAFDLAEIAKTHGDAIAAAFEDDLRHFAPDLLRWHLPRLDRGRTTIVPDQMIVLSRPEPGSPCLYVATPRWMAHGRQRLTLAIGTADSQGTYLETDLPGVLRLLDAGVDPRVRDALQRTLLHRLYLLDHEELLRRLLAAGVDIDARDVKKRTPLFAAICGGGSQLVEALLAAGARIDLTGEIHGDPVSLYRLVLALDRDDLEFIVERIETEYPELTEEE